MSKGKPRNATPVRVISWQTSNPACDWYSTFDELGRVHPWYIDHALSKFDSSRVADVNRFNGTVIITSVFFILAVFACTPCIPSLRSTRLFLFLFLVPSDFRFLPLSFPGSILRPDLLVFAQIDARRREAMKYLVRMGEG